MFIAAFCTIVKTGRQSKCPLMDKLVIKNIWCIYMYILFIMYLEYYLAIKMGNTANMDGPGGHYVK